ncbi:MAG: FHA domain-containing protein [Elusimicrobia bacterium]|nr:FHA domain-containing protein [Elusimicrobiota bacterium]
MPRLLLKFNAAVIKEYAVDKQILTVGRKSDNDIVIDNPAVSGNHCKISLQGDTFYVEDLGSTNGTYLNDKRIMKAGLHHNDVVGLATKHALVFQEDLPAVSSDEGRAGGQEATVLLSSRARDEMAHAAVASAAVSEPTQQGIIRVLKGGIGQSEYVLTGLSTYIGKSDRVQIPIQGTGLFRSAPEVAASIHRRADGYVLVPIQPNYPQINGVNVAGQTPLKDGDIIQCGGTTMQFSLKGKESAAKIVQ